MENSKQRPNFVVIVADDLGFSDLGCFGSEIKTPNLDQLASQGCRMTGFHSAAACSPTRAMLFSGTDNHVAGLGAMVEWKSRLGAGAWNDKPGYEGHLNFKVAALPEILQDRGYRTILSGKWHLGLTPELAPHSRGFDRSFTMLSGCHNHYGYEPQYGDIPESKNESDTQSAHEASFRTYKEWAPAVAHKAGMYNKQGEPIDIPANLPYSQSEFFSTDSFTDHLLECIEEATADGKPFFSCLTFTAPHWPLQAPRRLRNKYKGVYDDGPAALRLKRLARLEEMGLIPKDVTPHPVLNPLKVPEWDEMNENQRKKSIRAMETYAAMVEHIDEAVGRLTKRLDDLGVADNTVSSAPVDVDAIDLTLDLLVIFMSDNGAEGAAWEAMPHMGSKLMEVIEEYYDNSLENIGEPDSFVWYGPFWAQASTAPSRLMKSFSTQGGIRVPFIIRYPPFHSHQSCLPGKIIEQPTTVMDIATTVLDLAGVEHPAKDCTTSGWFRGRQVVPLKGRSWRGLFERGEKCHDENEPLGWELHGRAGMRIGPWKITFVPPPFGPGRWQLYNLESDPGEVFDLKDREPEKYRELSAAWDRYLEANGVVWGAPMPSVSIDNDGFSDAIESGTAWMKSKAAGKS